MTIRLECSCCDGELQGHGSAKLVTFNGSLKESFNPERQVGSQVLCRVCAIVCTGSSGEMEEAGLVVIAIDEESHYRVDEEEFVISN